MRPSDSPNRNLSDEELLADLRSAARLEPEEASIAPPAAERQTAADPNLGRRIGPYEIKELLASGGMGHVYRAVRVDDYQRPVAIKLIKRGLDTDEILRRFQDERQLLAALRHPHIAALLDGGTTDDGRSYFVMEHIEGRPLDHYCDARRLSVPARLRLFLQVCAAVQFAHKNLIVHRDLKPGNILVEERDGTPVPKLLDFGIAKVLAPAEGSSPTARTRPEDRPMTPEYASPEQVRGGPITVASDVYSLGVILYELLTGQRPYQFANRHDRGEIERTVCEQEPPRPSEIADRAPPRRRKRLAGDLDNITLLALRKEPAQRYASVEQLAADIERHLNHQPVRATPPSAWYQARKFVRRHQTLVGGLTATLLTLLAGVVGAGLMLARALAAEQRQREQRERADHEAERAKHEAALSAAQWSFFDQLFDAASPRSGKAGDTACFREVIDEASRLVLREGAETPEVEAALHATIGGVYRDFALFERAEPHLLRALELRKRAAAPVGDRCASLSELADLRVDLNRWREAEELLTEAIAVARQAREIDPAILPHCLDRLGTLRRMQGDLSTAEACLRESTALFAKLEPHKYPRVAGFQKTLAALYVETGRWEEAARLYVAALEDIQRRPGNNSLRAGLILNDLGVLYRLMDRLEDAEKCLTEAITTRKRLDVYKHPDTAAALSNLAQVYYRARKYELAEPAAREALALRRATLPAPDHPDVAISCNDLALVLEARGQTDEAESLYQEALRIFGRNPALPRTNQAAVLASYGAMLREHGQPAKAEPLLLEAYAIVERDPQTEAGLVELIVVELVRLYDARHAAEPGQGYDAKAAAWRQKRPAPAQTP